MISPDPWFLTSSEMAELRPTLSQVAERIRLAHPDPRPGYRALGQLVVAMDQAGESGVGLVAAMALLILERGGRDRAILGLGQILGDYPAPRRGDPNPD